MTDLPASSPDTGEILCSEEIRLLVDVGFVAAGLGLVPQAQAIFDGLRLFRPDASFADIGISTALMNAGQADEAVRFLQRRHDRVSPSDQTLQVFLGVAMRLAGRTGESEAILRRVVQRGPDDNPGYGLAAAMLAPRDGAAGVASR